MLVRRRTAGRVAGRPPDLGINATGDRRGRDDDLAGRVQADVHTAIYLTAGLCFTTQRLGDTRQQASKRPEHLDDIQQGDDLDGRSTSTGRGDDDANRQRTPLEIEAIAETGQGDFPFELITARIARAAFPFKG